VLVVGRTNQQGDIWSDLRYIHVALNKNFTTPLFLWKGFLSRINKGFVNTQLYFAGILLPLVDNGFLDGMCVNEAKFKVLLVISVFLPPFPSPKQLEKGLVISDHFLMCPFSLPRHLN